MAGLLTVANPAASAQGAPRQQRIGPNAINQLAAALRAQHGSQAAKDVFAAAGLESMLTRPPAGMVDQCAVADLYDALFRLLPLESASLTAAEAGIRTAHYLLRYRIPRPAQIILRCLPAVLASRLLLQAIAANAWTFAGSGRVVILPGTPSLIEIYDNPIAMPGCPWHVAAFERLFQALVTPHATVRHPKCCHRGASACRFEMCLEE